jgi:probable HAF family extracellular repeat protein
LSASLPKTIWSCRPDAANEGFRCLLPDSHALKTMREKSDMTTLPQKIFDYVTVSAPTLSTAGDSRLLADLADISRKRCLQIGIGRTEHLLLAVLIALCLGPLAQTVIAQQYQVSYLDSLGGTNSRGNSINNRSWIEGFSLLSGNQKRHATLWQNGSTVDLGTLGGPDKNSNVAWPVKNNRGIIAGISQTNIVEPNAERWSCSAFFGGQFGFTCLGFVWQDGVMRPLRPLVGGNNSFATGANNEGKVVGWAENGVHDSTCVAPRFSSFVPLSGDLMQLRSKTFHSSRGIRAVQPQRLITKGRS